MSSVEQTRQASIDQALAPAVLVLCYHAVSPGWHAPLSVTPERLKRQLSILVRRGWQGARFTEAVVSPPHSQNLVVTFDDGFLSVLRYARPILDELGLPGTMFAPTAFMGERQPLLWPGVSHWAKTPWASELESMTWDDLSTLVTGGWEVGSHTRTHPHLTQLDDARATEELERSRRECSERLGQCTSLAYPYGEADRRVARMARDAGYVTAACLSGRVTTGDAHLWPRVGVYHDDSAWRFRFKVSGAVRGVRATRLWPTS